MSSSVLHVPPDPSTRTGTQWRVIWFGLGMLIAGFLTVAIWPESLSNTAVSDYLPQAYCYLQQPKLVWFHVISDSLIGAAYVAISLMIGILVRRVRRDIPFSWIFIAFGVFIFSCGIAHMLQVVTVWSPLYWLLGDVKFVTAVASLATAVAMPPLIPRTLRLIQDARTSEERKQRLEHAHHELENLYSRLKDYDELKTRFFANVSHDLRTPLTLILGPTEKLLRSHGLTESERKGLETVQHNARLLVAHVNDLLDISRLEAGKLEPNYQATDLASNVRSSAAFFETLAADKKIQFRLDIPDSLLAEIDSEKVQRIVLNLLSNAFKFTPTDGIIRVSVKEGGKSGILEVADSGPGIPPDMRQAVFERYRQLPKDESRANLGGLGLAIVKDFVELHRGSIGISRAPEGGALFHIELPLRAPKNARFTRPEEKLTATSHVVTAAIEEASPARTEEALPVPARGTQPTVLVVEDNSEMRSFIVSALGNEYRVVAARNGKEALEKAQAERPELILSDIMMPVMTGDELVQELQRSKELASIPVILISARADERMRINLLKKGVQEYLTKPFSTDELLARVGNLITNQRVREVLRRELAGRTSSAEQLAQEITARNRQLQAALDDLRRSEARFRRLTESGVVGIIRADSSGSIIDANDAFLDMLGYTRQELNNGEIPWHSITPPEWDEADRLAGDQLMRTGRIIPFEKEYVGKDGSPVQVLIGAAMVDSETQEAIVLVLDISERKRAELALRNSEKLATIGRLAGTIAHEINNPLDAVSNLLFLIDNDPELTSTSRQYVRLASEEVSRVGQICRQMLGFYRESTTPVSIEINAVLESVMGLYRRKIQMQSVRVETRFKFQGTVRAFPGEIRQLFSNLFVNALEASPMNGRIVMRTKPSRDWRDDSRPGVRIMIHDSGTGIDPRVRANIFEPFFTTKGEKGTGLGLWVSRGIVEKHGGYVRVRTSTRPGNSGTCFMVFLPLDSSMDARHESGRVA